jgi:ubiquinone/menaquinone biosynthesis C-methylase UbiE
MRVSSEPSPFAGTAALYDRFRAPYAPATLDFIVERFGLDERSRALDLGCGPGTIAVALSRRVAQVVAIDPDAGMIAEGQRLAAAARRQNIEWLQSRAEDISPEIGRFRLVTMGQAFHWMDRDAVLRKLGTLIDGGGGVALIAPGQRRPQESWEPLADEVVTRFLGPRIRHPRSNPQEPRNEPALLRSEHFSHCTALEFPSLIERNVVSIIGCIYSTSSSARSLFGDNVDAFEAELTEALLARNPAGIFRERLETEVLIAPKS